MGQDAKLFVGLDVAKLHHAVAVAEDGRDGEVRYIGEINADPTSVRRMVCKFEKRRLPIHFCYEAGPTGYGLYRQIVAMGHQCSVIAPSSIPTRPGDRIKTNRRDALQLARLLRAGELTPVWVPDEVHEAIRELVRMRETVLEDLKRKRQAVMSLMLRNGRTYPGRTTWSKSHLRWLQEQRFEHPAQQLTLQEMLLAARHATERLKRTEGLVEEFLPEWSLAPTVTALQALRGVRLITATTIMVEIGDLNRFSNPRQLMGFLGLVPGERSTGDTVRRTRITKAGNARARRTLIESAWSYRHVPRTGKLKQAIHDRVAPSIRDIALKAEARLCARYRALSRRGKNLNTTITAIARELVGFIWAIGREMQTG